MSGYIGTQPVPQATQTRDSFTATSGQTSFATGGYTPNFLDIFLNGVKLAAADYTASNGSDVVLASGAATGDILEVVAFTTFTPADLPAGTPSIDDNGNATAITIDSNENVLVGTTSMTASDTSGTGMMYANGVALRVKRESSGGGQPCLDLNNTGSDDVMAMFRKDGVTIGSIGSNGTASWIACPAGSGAGLRFDGSDNRIVPTEGDGTNRNAAVDLGYSSSRFKDLYLSGGVFLGGTGSANKLSDYEEGTFTPSLGATSSNPSSTAGTRNGHYVKVGSLVMFRMRVSYSSISGGSGAVRITGLPFLSTNSADWSSITIGSRDSSGGVNPSVAMIPNNSATIRLWKHTSTSVQSGTASDLTLTNIGSSIDIYMAGTYYTDA